MKKNFIISVLLSICALTACTAEPATPPPTIKPAPAAPAKSTPPPPAIEPAPAATAKPTAPPVSDLQIDNGGNVSIAPLNSENTQTPETQFYIGNKNSKKFHRPDCRTLPAEKNRVNFKKRADAVNAGYSPCGNCQP